MTGRRGCGRPRPEDGADPGPGADPGSGTDTRTGTGPGAGTDAGSGTDRASASDTGPAHALPGVARCSDRPACPDRGAVLVVVVLLTLALLLVAHAVLVMAQGVYGVARAHARDVSLQALAAGAVEEEIRVGWRSWMDSLPVGSVRSRTDTVAPWRPRRVTWRRLGSEAWLVAAEAWRPPTPAVGLRRLVWIVDPDARVAALPGVVSTAAGAPVRLAGPVAAGPTPPLGVVDGPALGLLDLDALLAAADSTGSSGAPGPVVAGGGCVITEPWNWGDPAAPAGECGTWFVLRGSRDDVTLLGGVGQGVLVVEGDVRLEGGARFVGVVVASGGVALADGASVEGRIVAFGGIDVDATAVVVGSDPRARAALAAFRDRLGEALPLHPALRLGPG